MKVLFQARPDYLKNPAGDTVQMISTARALKALGVDIDFSADPNILLTSYDFVHIFNLTRIKESYQFFLNAQKQKKKIVVSPIYWNPELFLSHKEGNTHELTAWKFNQQMRRRVIHESDLLLPNSEMEMAVLRKDFLESLIVGSNSASNFVPYQVIPNGFPDSFLQADPDPFRKKLPNLPQEFILCVARISPRKNQHWLARMSQELTLPLVLIGPINNKNYFEEVSSYPNVIYLGSLQGELLASAYAAAKIHALPSWFETPGLSSLEAAACGTVVLSTDQGSPREYFQGMAVYVQPTEEVSLRRGLEQALHWDPVPLVEHVRLHFPWSKIGEMTLKAYETIHPV